MSEANNITAACCNITIDDIQGLALTCLLKCDIMLSKEVMSWLKTIYGQIRRSLQPKRKNKMKKALQKKLFEKVGNE